MTKLQQFNQYQNNGGSMSLSQWEMDGRYDKSLDERIIICRYCGYVLPKHEDRCILKELDSLLCEVSGIFDGWHSDGTYWTEYDQSVRNKIDVFRKKYTYDE